MTDMATPLDSLSVKLMAP